MKAQKFSNSQIFKLKENGKERKPCTGNYGMY